MRDISSLYKKLISGDRVILGQVMTLVESNLSQDRKDAIAILTLCESTLAPHENSFRLAISGSPGVGKSTFIEAIGKEAIACGNKVGVITIDPSSMISQGSILGDKSRMSYLSNATDAFIRSSASGGILGGLARRSMEMMTLLTAAGYNLIFLETVGVGQSEHMAWQFTDGFILVIQPGAGDELQGIKRGITELADIVIVNKADGDLENLADVARGQYENALHYFSSSRQGWTPKVVACSSIITNGAHEAWEVVRSYVEHLQHYPNGREDRVQQKLNWLNWSLSMAAQQTLIHHPDIAHSIENGLKSIAAKPDSAFSVEYEIEQHMQSMLKQSTSGTNPK